MRYRYFVYILTNANNTVLYTGMTNDLERRTLQHKEKVNKSFTSKYKIGKLVYYEFYPDINSAIAREKQIKGGSRKKKELLIMGMNPGWKDLFDNFELLQ
jgi:putative endonuclease